MLAPALVCVLHLLLHCPPPPSQQPPSSSPLPLVEVVVLGSRSVVVDPLSLGTALATLAHLPFR